MRSFSGRRFYFNTGRDQGKEKAPLARGREADLESRAFRSFQSVQAIARSLSLQLSSAAAEPIDAVANRNGRLAVRNEDERPLSF